MLLAYRRILCKNNACKYTNKEINKEVKEKTTIPSIILWLK